MSKAKSKFRRPLSVLLSTVCTATVVFPLLAYAGADPVSASPASAAARSKSALTSLIFRLGANGALKPEEAAELVKLAEADAADARVQAALTALATAQAEAAQARAESAMAQAAVAKEVPAPVQTANIVTAPVVVEPVVQVAPVVTPVEASTATVNPAPKELVQEDDSVRVTYVPEIVKAQLREEIKNDILDQAKKERWATARAVPDWVSRFTLYGDFRMRYESIFNHEQNDVSTLNSNFINFNAINTGAPFDLSTKNQATNLPKYNIDQDRSRLRVRARVGAAIDLGEGFTSNLRFATGENNSPVSQNQTLGSAGSGQGGNFSKYAVWLDRAYLKYQSEADVSRALTITFGRFENPFLASSIIWADDLGFDGVAVNIPAHIHFDGQILESVKPYFVVGAFPVFNTDLNFPSSQRTGDGKYKSNDKWLEAAQLGIDLKIGRDLKVKFGAAYYYFTKTAGKLSTPFVPRTAADAGDTDSRRPAFAQKGNTYMALRYIPSTSENTNVDGYETINRFQYFGLASTFRDVTIDVRVDYNHFEPFQISFVGEFVKNAGFSHAKISAFGPENNLGDLTNEDPSDDYLGGDTAWIVGLKLGNALLQKRWDWNVNANYRNVESDAVIDGFCDSDFGGGGTNVKGLTLGANVALAKRVSLGIRWMSSSQVSGLEIKNNILQFDINGKF